MLEDLSIRVSRVMTLDELDQRIVELLNLLDIEAEVSQQGGVDYVNAGVDPLDEDLLFAARTLVARRFGIPEAGH